MTAAIDLLPTVLKLLSGIGELRTRKMFGGTYIYSDGLFIATLREDTLYFKANIGTAQEFIKRGRRPFSYLKQGSVATLQYYEAPAEVFGSSAAMKRWARLAQTAARQDAASKKRRHRKVGAK